MVAARASQPDKVRRIFDFAEKEFLVWGKKFSGTAMLRPRGTRGKSGHPRFAARQMVDLFGVTPIGPHGGRRPGAGRPRKGEVRPPKPERPRNVLNSGDHSYFIRRLARDAQDGCRDAALLLQGVRDGLITAHTAGIEMNYRQRPEPNGRGSENAARARDWVLHRLLNPRPGPKAG